MLNVFSVARVLSAGTAKLPDHPREGGEGPHAAGGAALLHLQRETPTGSG